MSVAALTVLRGEAWDDIVWTDRFPERQHYRKLAYRVMRAAQDELEEFSTGFYQI